MAHEITVDVGDPVIGKECGQVWWPGGPGEPLHDGVIGHARHAHFARAPWLFGDPLDGVVDVAAFLLREDGHVAFGAERATGIDRHKRVTLRAPRDRIGAFQQCVVRQLVDIDLGALEQAPLQRSMLAVHAPQHDGRQLRGHAFGSVHIRVDGDPIAQGDRLVTIDDQTVGDFLPRADPLVAELLGRHTRNQHLGIDGVNHLTHPDLLFVAGHAARRHGSRATARRSSPWHGCSRLEHYPGGEIDRKWDIERRQSSPRPRLTVMVTRQARHWNLQYPSVVWSQIWTSRRFRAAAPVGRPAYVEQFRWALNPLETGCSGI